MDSKQKEDSIRMTVEEMDVLITVISDRLRNATFLVGRKVQDTCRSVIERMQTSEAYLKEVVYPMVKDYMVKNNNPNEFSENEAKLIAMFGYADLIESGSLSPLMLYRMCMEKAFVDGMQGPHVDALRRVMKAVRDCEPLRHTPEFEALTELKL